MGGGAVEASKPCDGLGGGLLALSPAKAFASKKVFYFYWFSSSALAVAGGGRYFEGAGRRTCWCGWRYKQPRGCLFI